MSNTEMNKILKAELHQLEREEEILRQMLGSIASRKGTLKSALDKLGSPARPKRGGKYAALTPMQVMSVKASFTQ
jgi:hypothetical protein